MAAQKDTSPQYSVSAAARELEVSRPLIYNYMASGIIGYVEIAGRKWITRDQIARFFAARKAGQLKNYTIKR